MHEQICEILGLTSLAWPPDHYTLLGLKPGESDLQLIEQRVHERMRLVRPYQLNYPDQVTEALNRLAQAYGCLMDRAARLAYDQSLRAPPPSKPEKPQPENGPVDPKDPLAWLFGPWDRLVGAEFTTAPSGHQPHFQDWATSMPPPRQRKHTIDKPEAAVSGDPSPLPSSGLLRSSLLWKHSGKLLIILSLLALLVAAWRQLAP